MKQKSKPARWTSLALKASKQAGPRWIPGARRSLLRDSAGVAAESSLSPPCWRDEKVMIERRFGEHVIPIPVLP